MTSPHPAAGPGFDAYGAVDLSALAAPARPPGGPSGADGDGAVVRAVTEASFAVDVLEQSRTVPVVVDFWATWCGPCKTLSPLLERLAAEYAGRFVLATVDVDAEQRLAAAFQVQSIPSVFGVVAGQPVPLFQGALPEAQLRPLLDELLRVAAANGVTGSLAATDKVDGDGTEPAAPPAAPLPPELVEAQQALERDDLDAAAAAYRRRLAAAPDDADAKLGLAEVELVLRSAGHDPAAALAASDADPADVGAALAAADAELLAGRVEAAFERLLEAVRRTAGEDRDRARARLLELFELVGGDDPRVAAGRRALATALF